MRVLFCGSRTWRNQDLIYNELRKFDPATTIIVHGAAQGADLITHSLAKSLHFEVEEWPVTKWEWDAFGRPAGPHRNKRMVNTLNKETDMVVAFHQNGSTGTASTIRYAAAKGIIPKVIKG